jgi:hypothetical protein
VPPPYTPSLKGRLLVFVLAATSIANLLAEMYDWMDMRVFFWWILVPATAALVILAGRAGPIRRLILVGTASGLLAAIAYDLFRLPFVFSDAWGLSAVGVPQMPLFKVFPRFGARLLGQPLEQPTYTLAAHLLGWAYHFSNGAMFGVMFASLYPTPLIRRPRLGICLGWATLMAVGIEICLLASPYARFFNIQPTPRFVIVTLAAHIVFGLAMGLCYWKLGSATEQAAKPR